MNWGIGNPLKLHKTGGIKMVDAGSCYITKIHIEHIQSFAAYGWLVDFSDGHRESGMEIYLPIAMQKIDDILHPEVKLNRKED